MYIYIKMRNSAVYLASVQSALLSQFVHQSAHITRVGMPPGELTTLREVLWLMSGVGGVVFLTGASTG